MLLVKWALPEVLISGWHIFSELRALQLSSARPQPKDSGATDPCTVVDPKQLAFHSLLAEELALAPAPFQFRGGLHQHALVTTAGPHGIFKCSSGCCLPGGVAACCLPHAAAALVLAELDPLLAAEHLAIAKEYLVLASASGKMLSMLIRSRWPILELLARAEQHQRLSAISLPPYAQMSEYG